MRLWLMQTPEGCLCESACLLLSLKHSLLHLNNDAFLFGWMPCPSSFSFTVTMRKAMGTCIEARHNINFLEKYNFSSKIQGYKQLLSDLLTQFIILIKWIGKNNIKYKISMALIIQLFVILSRIETPLRIDKP